MRKLNWLIPSGAALVSALAMFWLTNKFAVNIFFWDEWDFYNAYFKPHNLWQVFSWQHGAHRQGISFVLRGLMDHFSGWNSRVEDFTVFAYLLGAAALALAIKKKLTGALSYRDAIVPVIVLTLSQMEQLVMTGNSSHSACPLFLVMTYCWLWTLERGVAQFVALSLVQFFLVFTGFGITSVPVLLVVLIADIKRHRGGLGILAMTSLVVSVGAFFTNYSMQPMTHDIGLTGSGVLAYLKFVALMQSAFFGLERTPPALVSGAISFGVLAITFLWNLHRFEMTGNKQNLITTILAGMTITFSFTASAGRIVVGVPESSRYMTLLVPGFLAMFFQVETFQKIIRFTLWTLLVSVVAHGSYIELARTNEMPWHHYTDVKANWRACYLADNNADACSQKVGLGVYPDVHVIESRLQFLKANQLNFFKPE